MQHIIKTLGFSLVLILFFATNASAQEWNVPSTAKNKNNPYDYSKLNISKGKKVYQVNCKSCHGDPTKNNPLALNPAPTDLGSINFLNQSDGEIYYKVKKGKGAMPTFNKTLNDEAKWMVINYLRSFDANKSNRKSIASKPSNPEVVSTKLVLTEDSENKTILAHLSGITTKGKKVNLKSIELSALVKRMFGELNVAGDEAITDEEGKLLIQFPKNLPGDRAGHLDVTVKVTDDDLFGKVEEKLITNIGNPTNPKNILDERAMWGTRANAPIWIIATFLFMVISAWSIIGYALFQVFRLYRMSKQ